MPPSYRDSVSGMDRSDVSAEQESPTLETTSETQPGASIISIADLLTRPDFPECARGQRVDIGGTEGLVADIVGNSLKLKVEAGTTMSFNVHALKRLYGPREEQKPTGTSSTSERSNITNAQTVIEEPEPETEAPKRNIITEPNFDVPVKSIREFTGRSDFPQCTFGEFVDIGGYKGVVVEIVKGSLKVRSEEEVIRSYNSQVLRKLYPPEK